MIRKIRELGLKQPIFSNFWSGKREAIETAGKANAEGIIFMESDLRQPKFLAVLQDLFGEPRASAVTFSCYSALGTALYALSQTAARRIRPRCIKLCLPSAARLCWTRRLK